MSIVLLVLGAAALALYIPEKLRGYTVKAVLKKSLVSLLFIAVAVSAGSASALGSFVVLGLVCGLLGDIWLDLKYVYPAQDGIYTYAGFASFGLGHILYVAGLLRHYGAGLFLLPAFALAAAGAAAVLLTEKPMRLRYGPFKPVVLGYGFLLFSTVFVSGALLLVRGGAATAVFFAGSVLFAVSDLILSGTYFGEGRERPADIVANYLSYYGGQYLIACSLLLL